jgi:hypothetical protein
MKGLKKWRDKKSTEIEKENRLIKIDDKKSIKNKLFGIIKKKIKQ